MKCVFGHGVIMCKTLYRILVSKLKNNTLTVCQPEQSYSVIHKEFWNFTPELSRNPPPFLTKVVQEALELE